MNFYTFLQTKHYSYAFVCVDLVVISALESHHPRRWNLDHLFLIHNVLHKPINGQVGLNEYYLIHT